MRRRRVALGVLAALLVALAVVLVSVLVHIDAVRALYAPLAPARACWHALARSEWFPWCVCRRLRTGAPAVPRCLRLVRSAFAAMYAPHNAHKRTHALPRAQQAHPTRNRHGQIDPLPGSGNALYGGAAQVAGTRDGGGMRVGVTWSLFPPSLLMLHVPTLARSWRRSGKRNGDGSLIRSRSRRATPWALRRLSPPSLTMSSAPARAFCVGVGRSACSSFAYASLRVARL